MNKSHQIKTYWSAEEYYITTNLWTKSSLIMSTLNVTSSAIIFLCIFSLKKKKKKKLKCQHIPRPLFFIIKKKNRFFENISKSRCNNENVKHIRKFKFEGFSGNRDKVSVRILWMLGTSPFFFFSLFEGVISDISKIKCHTKSFAAWCINLFKARHFHRVKKVMFI
jgi:hypothetical protein